MESLYIHINDVKEAVRALSLCNFSIFASLIKPKNHVNIKMTALYIAYPNCQTLSGELGWSHYCELLSISDKNKRSFYEKEDF